jgi:ubiquinone/menaquinone biosynthesis C-methylase UbiE
MKQDGPGNQRAAAAPETREQAARAVFGERAAFYATSESHTEQAVLDRVVALARPEPHMAVLDVATGAGHTAFALAPYVARVVATDITPEMLAQAECLRSERGLMNVEFRPADVHALPFEDGAFDVVTCRRAAHHFARINDALAEMRRVLRPAGRLVIDDRSVPEDDFVDACMNRLDVLHDRSHVREYRPSEWRRMLDAAGFAVEACETYERHRPLESLTAGVADEDADGIHRVIESLTPEQRRALRVEDVGGVTHTTHWFVTLAAVRPS